MKTAISCVCILLLSMLSNSAYAADEGSKEEKRLISATLAYVANLSREPESVRFRNISTYFGIVCGEVNVKNSRSGYIGYAKFSSKEGSDFQAPDFNRPGMLYVAPFDCIAARKAYFAAQSKLKNARTPAEKAAAEREFRNNDIDALQSRLK